MKISLQQHKNMLRKIESQNPQLKVREEIVGSIKDIRSCCALAFIYTAEYACSLLGNSTINCKNRFMDHKGRECKRDVNILLSFAYENGAKSFNAFDGKMMSGKIEIIFHL